MTYFFPAFAAVGLTIGGCIIALTPDPENCGDGELNTGETCDDGNRQGGDGCSSFCRIEQGWACEDASTASPASTCHTICPDGLVRGDEECDTNNLNGQSCSSLGYGTGTLACDNSCRYDISGCDGGSECGNNILEPPEACDGTDVAGRTCQGLGYYTGTLACNATCTDFDETGCAERCGDAIINGPEVCDGSRLDGVTCADRGLYGGTLSCDASCLGYDESQCWTAPKVVINEVAIYQVDGIELLNLADVAVDLDGWVLEWHGEDNQGDPVSGTIALPAFSLDAHAYVALIDDPANPGPPATVGGVGQISLNVNISWFGLDSGAAMLRNAADEPQDFLRWGDSTVPPPPGTGWDDTPEIIPAIYSDTYTLSRVPDGEDTDTAADWCISTLTAVSVNDQPCLDIAGPGRLLVTEIKAGAQPGFEIHNPGTDGVDLGGWVVQTNTAGGTWALPAFSLGPGQYVEIVANLAVGETPYVDGTIIRVPWIQWMAFSPGYCQLSEPILNLCVDFARWGGNFFTPDAPCGWADSPSAVDAPTINDSVGRATLTDTDAAADWCRMSPTLGQLNGGCL